MGLGLVGLAEVPNQISSTYIRAAPLKVLMCRESTTRSSWKYVSHTSLSSSSNEASHTNGPAVSIILRGSAIPSDAASSDRSIVMVTLRRPPGGCTKYKISLPRLLILRRSESAGSRCCHPFHRAARAPLLLSPPSTKESRSLTKEVRGKQKPYSHSRVRSARSSSWMPSNRQLAVGLLSPLRVRKE